MKTVFKYYLWFLVVLAGLPVVLEYTAQAMENFPQADLVMRVALTFLLLGTVLYVLRQPLIAGPFRVLGYCAAGFWTAVGWSGKQILGIGRASGAKFMGPWAKFWLLNPMNQGFLVDGHKHRLSQKHSFQSVLTVGGMGKGKSTVFVMPNLYTLDQCSFVVTETSGEIYDQTAGYLRRKGFRIEVLDLMNVEASQGYNPLAGLRTYTEVQQAADLIIRSAFPEDRDPFWSQGATKIVRILIQCLKNQGDPDQMTLGQVKYWLNHFDAHLPVPGGSRLDAFVADSTTDDRHTFEDYRGFTNGNEKTMLSFLSSADTALSALGNPEIANLVSRHDFDFARLRHQKTALYVKVRQQDMRFYAFLLNLFYTDLFRSLLSDLNPRALPVYLLLDEFGQSTIPGFEVYATTARKYRVGFWIFLQSLSQLEARYGRREAETILDGLQTEIYLPGVNLDTAKALERRLGTVKQPYEQGGATLYRHEPLMSEAEIMRLPDDRALFLHSNLDPAVLRTVPFYRQRRMRRLAE